MTRKHSFSTKKSYCKSYYFRYSHVLYRITTLEKSERFDLLPHDFMIIILVGLRKGNCRNERNAATVLRAMVKSHNDLNGTKVFACGCSGRNLNFFSKFAVKSPCCGPFIVKLQHVMAYKRLLGQLYQKETPTRRLLHNYFL